MEPDPVSRRVVLITGAAGGLGSVLSQEFLSQGWHVAAGIYRTQAVASARLWPIPLDVTSADSCRAAVDNIVDRWGGIEALVNNAAITADAPVMNLMEADWDEVLGVNLLGAFHCCRAVLETMLHQRSGHILNVASFSGRAGARGQSNYAAAKSGLLGLTVSLAREVGAHNVRVNAIAPGVLPTRMTSKLRKEQLDQFAAANVLGRINSLEEVARFIVFLAGMENVSGQVFQLDSRIRPWT